MIIKRLRLNNIRSYVNESVEFPKGSILFEGDVGSGKTTILIAIEFALFGLSSDLKGEHLLRAGATKGFVELSIDVAGKEIILHRGLEKTNGRVSQTDCYMVLDGSREDYSVTEMKSRVLSILSFNENVHPQASSLIYRYAVFTPQERMKEILSSNADERLETIRRAFMMEDYKNAAANADEVQKILRAGIKAGEYAITDLGNLKDGLKTREGESRQLETDVSKLAHSMEEERKKLDGVNMQLEGLRKSREKHAALTAEMDSLSRTVLSEEKNMQALSQKSMAASSRVEIIKDKMKILGEIKTSVAEKMKDFMGVLGMTGSILDVTEKSVQETRRRIKSETEKSLSELAKTRMKIQDLESLLSKGTCPLCEQKIDADHFTNRVNNHSAELAAIEKTLGENKEYEEASERLASATLEMKNLDTEAGMFSQSYSEELDRKNELDVEMENSIKSIADSNKRKDMLAGDIEKLGLEISKIADLESKERLHRRSLESVSSEHAAKEQRLNDVRDEIKSDSERVRSMEGKAREIKAAKECAEWLRAYFIPAVESIERHVFASYNLNFDALFKKWFSMLMDSGEISVRVDDKFTPVIEQNGYEQDVEALSGGEKTSVALAYRLALNTVVKEIAISLRNNLLILDEPTDGFSKEQLHRMRDILDELQCDQIIIVSHERELEAFVDNIMEVRKEGSVSKVVGR
ncbi:MAG: SMC family ATPase [Candidatus Aenigmarchaeota archaeon]|nr:SMC family ATPase [Candidatus Aenigmarchaeota archaeon]